MQEWTRLATLWRLEIFYVNFYIVVELKFSLGLLLFSVCLEILITSTQEGVLRCKKVVYNDWFFYWYLMQADFMKMPFPDSSFDAVYAFQATCHAPDAVCQSWSFSSRLEWIMNFLPYINLFWFDCFHVTPIYISLIVISVVCSTDATRRFSEYWSLVSILLLLSGAWPILLIPITRNTRKLR